MSVFKIGDFDEVGKFNPDPYGSITQIKTKNDEKCYALKKILIDDIKEKKGSATLKKKDIDREVEFLKENLPGLVPCVDSYFDDTKKEFSIFFEFFEENLVTLIEEHGKKNFSDYFPIFNDIISGVYSLSKKGIDIGSSVYPQVIFIKDSKKAYLGYFGIDPYCEHKSEKEKWMAPELLDSRKKKFTEYEKKQAVIFSLGLILLYMLDPEFFLNTTNIKENEDTLLKNHLKKYKSHDGKNGKIPIFFYYVVQAMLSFDPNKRPRIDELASILDEVKLALERVGINMPNFISDSEEKKGNNKSSFSPYISKNDRTAKNDPIFVEDKLKEATKYPVQSKDKGNAEPLNLNKGTVKNKEKENETETIKEKKAELNFENTVGDLNQLLENITIDERQESFFNFFKNDRSFNTVPKFTSVSAAKPMAIGLKDYKFNPVLQKLISEISIDTPVFRSIRGDGNCFYRSFGYLYMEYLFILEDTEEALFNIVKVLIEENDFLDVCNSKKQSRNSPKEIQIIFLGYLKLLYNFSKKNREKRPDLIIEKLVNLFNKSEDFDIAVVLLIRKFSQKAVDELRKKDETQVESSIISCLEVMEKEIEEIKEWGKEAEQFMISILSNFLKIKIIIHYLEKNQINTSEPKVIRDEHIPANCSHNFSIDLYFRPGHYDAAYDRLYAQKYYLSILDKGFDIKEEFEERSKADSFEEEKEESLKISDAKERKINCSYCKFERYAEDFVSFENCKHNKKCILCVISERDLTSNFAVYCSLRNCCGKIDYHKFMKMFDNFKQKSICHVCFAEVDSLIEAKKCGHKFCNDCIFTKKNTEYSISGHCFFRTCKGEIIETEINKFLKETAPNKK